MMLRSSTKTQKPPPKKVMTHGGIELPTKGHRQSLVPLENTTRTTSLGSPTQWHLSIRLIGQPNTRRLEVEMLGADQHNGAFQYVPLDHY